MGIKHKCYLSFQLTLISKAGIFVVILQSTLRGGAVGIKHKCYLSFQLTLKILQKEKKRSSDLLCTLRVKKMTSKFVIKKMSKFIYA